MDYDSDYNIFCATCGSKKIDVEEYWQTCRRVVEGTFELQRRHIQDLGMRWNHAKAQKTAQDMFRLMWEFKFLPPGRGLWMMGAPLVMDRGNGAGLFNCGWTSTQDLDVDFPDSFCFLFEASAHGVGIGFDTKGKGRVTLVEPKLGTEILIVEDSREGWSELLRRVLNAYIGKGALPRKIDYSKVRPFGAPIKTFGGTASGPEALRDLIEIDIPSIMTPGKITSTQIVDLMNAIGKCVVAGGARRSSEIALGDIDDEEFMRLKQDPEKLKAWRWNSNNSHIVPPNFDGFRKFTSSITQNGEPGFVFLENCQAYGRMSDPPTWEDARVSGVNPCAEQTLEDRELCNIVETLPARCENLEEYKRVLKVAYLYAKTVTLTKTPWARSNEIMMRNRRIGISMSGIIQNINRRGFATHIQWCRDGYDYLKELDKIYSEWLCVRSSIKKTTVKPSGSVSLLCGSTPGIHYPHSEFVLRRVRFTNGSPLLIALTKAGYPTELDYYDQNATVVGFPIKEEFFSRGKKDVSMWEQLENAAQMQAHWSDNSVSITVTLKEGDDLQQGLERYQNRLKTVSFLPPEHGYTQPPYEEISEEEFKRLTSSIKKLNLAKAEHEITDKFCDSDVCQIGV